MYIWGMLKNTATGRYHPIAFRRAPMPGNSDGDSIMQRYKSLGHHTEGFDAEAEAKAHIAASIEKAPGSLDAGVGWEWDGEGMPAMVEWFSQTPLRRVAEKEPKWPTKSRPPGAELSSLPRARQRLARQDRGGAPRLRSLLRHLWRAAGDGDW